MPFEFVPPEMLDITAPQVIEVEVREDGKVLWINIDGICRLRVCQINELVITDRRS